MLFVAMEVAFQPDVDQERGVEYEMNLKQWQAYYFTEFFIQRSKL